MYPQMKSHDTWMINSQRPGFLDCQSLGRVDVMEVSRKHQIQLDSLANTATESRAVEEEIRRETPPVDDTYLSGRADQRRYATASAEGSKLKLKALIRGIYGAIH